MYFVNFSKCSICKLKKSVALNKRTLNQKICRDCNPDYYEEVCETQKAFWISKNIEK